MNDRRDFTGGGEIERHNPDGCSLKTRIFVGGLGASVTPSDLEATFSALGRVHGVEIVRSNDRSFGYMDFEPFSDKALSKLFSSYNGCMWKGGRLRLEKAKEHYLVRLHREWVAEAEQSATITAEVASTTSNTPDKRTQMLSDQSGLKMFFPRLKKFKVLPSKGTGKHKYSFQRVESLPLHQLQVCGCKEHSMHPESDESNQYVLDLGNDRLYDGGICEKELNIMNRVMQRLLGNEDQIQMATEQSEKTQPVHIYNYTKRAPGKARIDMERFNDSDDTEGSNDSEAAVKNLDELAMAENIAQDLVEKGSDNIETISLESDQVVKDMKDEVNLSRGITEKIARNNTHDPTSRKANISNVKSGENDSRTKVQRSITPKNTDFLPMEGDTEYRPEVHEPEVRKRARVGDTVCSPIQHEEARGDSNIDIGLEMKSDTDSKVQDCGRVLQLQDDAHSWVQKASWKDLVGETGRVSFSLSSIIGGVSSSPFAVKSKESETHGAANNYSLEDVTKEVSRKMPKRSGKYGTKEGLPCSNDEVSRSFRGQVIKPPCSESEDKSVPVGEMKTISDAIKGQGPEENTTEMQRQDKKCKVDKGLPLSTQDRVSSATCTFMRSEDAEDEWLKSKAVVRGYAKTRRKMALKSIKMLGVDPAGRR